MLRRASLAAMRAPTRAANPHRPQQPSVRAARRALASTTTPQQPPTHRTPKNATADTTPTTTSTANAATSDVPRRPRKAGKLYAEAEAASKEYIPQITLHQYDGRQRKHVLVLCTGGTLTMAQDAKAGGGLAPVQGALSEWMRDMPELSQSDMPSITLHEYEPLLDSSDMGPPDWGRIAHDIDVNYLHFDGFVVLTGTDTMAYAASALAFMLENLGKPVIFTGSQIPLCEPYNDARRNLIMSLIFASRDTITEVCIFFHDRLLRACRATKVNSHRLFAFDSPNMPPLAQIGISIEENEHLVLPPARGALRMHPYVEPRLITVRLVPGFDDAVLKYAIEGARESGLRALVLQLYGTGNLPSNRDAMLKILADATASGILVVATTQCLAGSVRLGHYAVGHALVDAGVIGGADMTLEAVTTKLGYLCGRGDLTNEEIAKLMPVSLRGELTPADQLAAPTFPSSFERAARRLKNPQKFHVRHSVALPL